MGTEENKELVLAYWDKYNAGLKSGNLDEAFDMMADDLTWEVMGNPKSPAASGVMTKAEVVAGHSPLLAACPNVLRLTPKSMIAEGDKVALEAESYGEHVSGKIYHNKYHFLIEVRDEKIHAVREYLDTQHVSDVFLGGTSHNDVFIDGMSPS
jgi:uncharacterized protein